MIIETENKECLLEYLLTNELKDEKVLPYFEGKASINVVDTIESEDLFSSGISIVKINKVDQVTNNESIFWIEKLSTDDKKYIKKNNLSSLTLKKITKSLANKLESELNFKSSLSEYISYFEIIEEEYLISLGGIKKNKKTEVLPFMLSINNMGQFYKKVNDDDMQLLLSIIFSKALKVNNSIVAKKITLIDKTIKTSSGRINQKNIWGANMYDC